MSLYDELFIGSMSLPIFVDWQPFYSPCGFRPDAEIPLYLYATADRMLTFGVVRKGTVSIRLHIFETEIETVAHYDFYHTATLVAGNRHKEILRRMLQSLW